MNALDHLFAAASKQNKVIALSEGDDPRIIDAAIKARATNMARIILVGDQARIEAGLTAVGSSSGSGIDIHDPSRSALTRDFVKALVDLRSHKGMTEERAAIDVQNRLIYAALLVRLGHADGTVGGAVETTSDTVRAALQIIGKAPDAAIVSSFFLMLLDEGHDAAKGAYIFSDCGLVVDPDEQEMAAIALASAKSYANLIGTEPRVAMLSFSTKGSARHAAVSKVVQATERAQAAAPDLVIDGELQFDAAFVPEVAAAKAPDSPVAGRANVFVFPNLDAGNLGYKIAQRIGGAKSIGPVLQGLSRPANDLSRGCTAEDVLHMIAVTVAQAAQQNS